MAELVAVPKPERLPRLTRGLERRRLRRAVRERASAKRRRSYGGSDYSRWAKQILQRDRYRCLAAGDGCQRRATTAHHLKTVGSGGKNELTNGASVCPMCHALIHDGHIDRETLYARLTDLYGYDYTGPPGET